MSYSSDTVSTGQCLCKHMSWFISLPEKSKQTALYGLRRRHILMHRGKSSRDLNFEFTLKWSISKCAMTGTSEISKLRWCTVGNSVCIAPYIICTYSALKLFVHIYEKVKNCNTYVPMSSRRFISHTNFIYIFAFYIHSSYQDVWNKDVNLTTNHVGIQFSRR